MPVLDVQSVRFMDIEISSQTIEQMVDRILEYPERTKLQVLAPVVSGRKGMHMKAFRRYEKARLCSCSD